LSINEIDVLITEKPFSSDEQAVLTDNHVEVHVTK